MIEANGRSHSISRSHRGRIHDFKIRKQERLLPGKTIQYADSGYQGWQKIQNHVMIPYKSYENRPLTSTEKITIINTLPLEYA
ncbi:hypothetical protein BIY23_00675 [Wolbachia pipientis]|uniref:DDE Tnp4 domain-containing protein n=1 Tax=Wolbachia pipientis TaxID=955 RepID=A0A1E7QKK0_WOLPI|nr:hypothetical protein BIY23_00675 [Wolbachia pipientis]